MRVMPEPTERIGRLRERTAERVHNWQHSPEAELAAARSWLGSSGESSHMLRRGALAGDILASLTPVIDADELVVGKPCRRECSEAEQRELDLWRRYGVPAAGRVDGQRAHMAIDYELVLRRGTSGVRRQIECMRKRLRTVDAGDLAKDLFYRGCLAALGGMEALASKYATLAENLADGLSAEGGGAARVGELRAIAQTCRRVPLHPAGGFSEAVQAVHFVTWCMCAGNQMALFQLGRPDRYLLPFYSRDVSVGLIAPGDAQELIDCLCLLLNEYTPRGLAVGLMVGGRDAAGSDVTNDLTYMFVNSIGHTRLAYPGIGVCWNSETPAALVALSAQTLSQGHTHPAVFNDDVITEGLIRWGLPVRDACLYIHSTCVEITPIAMSNVYVASPYHNLVQYLHDCIGVPPLGTAAAPLPAPAGVASFEGLIDRFATRLEEGVALGVEGENKAMMSRDSHGGFPLLSCFVSDCLSRGTDIDQGGARVNWVEPSFVGLANLVDSLATIRQLVFRDARVTLAELAQALTCGFEGHESVRGMIERLPKYGNDVDDVDSLAERVTGLILAACEKRRTYWGGAVVPGLFCWQMHTELGGATRASADGRAAGFPFADGSGPAQGRELLGPTAMVLSSTKWDHSPMVGGIAVNMRLSPARLAAPLGVCAGVPCRSA